MKSKMYLFAAFLASAGISHAQTYAGPGFAINDNVANFGTIAVSGATSPITDVEVVIYGLSHTWFRDLTCTITAPNGASLNLFNRPATGQDPNGTYTFTDSALRVLDATDLAGGTFRAQGGSFATTFGGIDANGTWRLNINDVAAGDIGRIDGWVLTVVPTPASAMVAGIGGVMASRRRRG